jgi:hypothetical protein
MSKTFTREEISSVLQKGVATVSFTKVNGDTRIMECTLNGNHIDLDDLPKKKTDRVKKPNPAVLSVWDVNAKGWRSFRVENVFNVESPQENLDLG